MTNEEITLHIKGFLTLVLQSLALSDRKSIDCLRLTGEFLGLAEIMLDHPKMPCGVFTDAINSLHADMFATRTFETASLNNAEHAEIEMLTSALRLLVAKASSDSGARARQSKQRDTLSTEVKHLARVNGLYRNRD